MLANRQQTHWKFHWLTCWEEIWEEGFIRQWQEWLDESPSAHVFFHPALVKAWVETYLPLRDLRPCFLIAESAGYTVFLPMVLWRRNWKNAFQRLLVPVGYSDYDYHDPIITGENLEDLPIINSFWVDFINVLQESEVPVRFDRFASGRIRQAFAGAGDGWQVGESCLWTDLRPFMKPEDFLLSLKRKLRADLRRYERRINEVGALQHRIFSGDMEKEALHELTPFLAAHVRRWPDAYKAPHFHENIVKRSMEAGLLHFSMLQIGEKSAVWHLGFVFRDRYYFYLRAQEEKFDSLSPGKLLLLTCIEDAISKGISIYDFLRGQESYKSVWTDKADSLWSFQLDSNHLISRIRNVAVDRVKPGLQTLPMK